MRSNVSWNFDSYFIGRKQIVKMKIRGKTLVAYFPIDPKEMEGTKYVGEDASKIARYKAVPFAYRINGARKLKYAMELIEKVAEAAPDKAPEYIDKSQVGAAIPFESFDELYLKEYVKIGGFLPVTRSSSAVDEDEDDEPVNSQDVAADEDDEDDGIVPVSNAEVKKEEFNFTPGKR
jgi:hypothetical protein